MTKVLKEVDVRISSSHSGVRTLAMEGGGNLGHTFGVVFKLAKFRLCSTDNDGIRFPRQPHRRRSHGGRRAGNCLVDEKPPNVAEYNRDTYAIGVLHHIAYI